MSPLFDRPTNKRYTDSGTVCNTGDAQDFLILARQNGTRQNHLSAIWRLWSASCPPKREIEVAAKRRLADEYDAAQERGEVAQSGQYSRSEAEHLPTASDIGLSRKDSTRPASSAMPSVVTPASFIAKKMPLRKASP